MNNELTSPMLMGRDWYLLIVHKSTKYSTTKYEDIDKAGQIDLFI